MPGPGSPGGQRTFERAVAVAVILLLGLRQFVAVGMTTGYLAALVLAPVWLTVLRRYRGGVLLPVTAVLALCGGVVLAAIASVDHGVSRGMAAESLVLVVGTCAGVGVLLWARTLLPVRTIGVVFGLAMAVGALLDPERLSANLWKSGYAIPVAVICLALADGPRRHGRQVLVLGGLAAASAVFDSRSYFGTFLLAALLVGWQLRGRAASRAGSRVRAGVFLASAAACAYYVGRTLLLDGYLGAQAQARSAAQVDLAGSLILGGRPELAASAALVSHRPWGYGLGVRPNLLDVNRAKQGMAALNYDPDNGYVDRYMFGGRIELHSVVGDLWALYGLAGCVLAAVLGGLVVSAVARALARRTGSALVIFLGLWTLWNLFFSPLYSAAPTLMLVVGLGLATRADAGPRPGTPDDATARPAPTPAPAGPAGRPPVSHAHAPVPRRDRRPSTGGRTSSPIQDPPRRPVRG